MKPNRITVAMRKAALSAVAPAAFNEGVSRSALLTAIVAAYSKQTADEVRREYIAGRIASSRLLPATNAPVAERIANARLIMAKAGATGSGKLKKGQSRRTEVEERAYASARVLWSGILRDAGIKTVVTQGGSKATGKRKAQAGRVKAKAAANNNRPASPKVRDLAALLDYFQTQGKAMLATVTKNAKLVPPQLSSAVQDFNNAVTKLAADRAI